MEKGKKTILAIIVVLILIVVMLIYNLMHQERVDPILPTTTSESETPEGTTDDELVKLTKMIEYERIKYYLNKYLSYLEDGEYEKAYELLYPGFKEQYFKTLDEFKTYVGQKYSPVITIEYNGYNMLGEYYVLDIKFLDILNATAEETPTVNQKFVIVENNLNDFVLSFQAE